MTNDALHAAAAEYCLAFRDYRAELRSVSGTELGTGVWAAYNQRLRAHQARMDAAWDKFEREAAKRSPTPPPSNETGPELFSKPKPERTKP